MKNAVKSWKEIGSVLQEKTILLFLDYDGTIAPIVSIPEKAALSSACRDLLKSLSLLSGIRLIIISGRDIDDVRKRVAVPGAVYVGSHGCMITGPGIKRNQSFPRECSKKLSKLYREMSIMMRDISGVHIENKDLSVAVHYRNVSNGDLPDFFARLDRISAPYIASSCFRITEGKKVVEICLATQWNKGSAVEWIMRRLKVFKGGASYMPVYIGDDKTDEHAFEVLKGKGVTIHVGRGHQTAAGYRLENPAEVLVFLREIYKAL